MDWTARLKPIIEEIEKAAYQRGWDDAIENLISVAKFGVMASAPVSAPQPSRKRRKKPLIDLVHDVVKTTPGLRGTEIVDLVMTSKPNASRKSIDRTTRTALMRLKKREAVESREGGWYPKEAA